MNSRQEIEVSPFLLNLSERQDKKSTTLLQEGEVLMQNEHWGSLRLLGQSLNFGLTSKIVMISKLLKRPKKLLNSKKSERKQESLF